MDDREDKARLKRLQDYADLQDESAGRSNGKMRRFTPEGATPEAQEARRRDDDNVQIILAIEQQAIILRSRLREFEQRALEDLRVAERRVQEAEEHLERLRERATRGPDGRRVYRSRDGRWAIDDDLRRLSPEECARIKWRPGSPSAEDIIAGSETFSHRKAERDEAARRLEQARELQQQAERGGLTAEERSGLGARLNRLEDEADRAAQARDSGSAPLTRDANALPQADPSANGGLSADDLAALDASLDRLDAGADQDAAPPQSRLSAARDMDGDSFDGAPDLTGQFAAAHAGLRTPREPLPPAPDQRQRLDAFRP